MSGLAASAAFKGRREPRRGLRRMPEPNRGDRRRRGCPSRKIFRPQNCGAVAHALPVTGRVEDDLGLSRLYNRFYLQGDRSITNAERTSDRKLARL